MKTFLLNALAVGTLALGATSAHAAVLTYGTFTGADPDSTDSLVSFGSAGSLGVGFTATRSDLTISTVRFDLSTTGDRGARLRIYSHASPADANDGFGTGNAGTLLATATGAPTGIAGVIEFTVSVGLTSGTRYWLMIDANGGTTGNLVTHSATGTETISGVSGLTTLSGYHTSLLDSGGSATLVDNGQLPNFNVVVPEPHEYALVAGIGLCAFAAYRRRSARATA